MGHVRASVGESKRKETEREKEETVSGDGRNGFILKSRKWTKSVALLSAFGHRDHVSGIVSNSHVSYSSKKLQLRLY